MNDNYIFSDLKHLIDPEAESAKTTEEKKMTYEDIKNAQADGKKSKNSNALPDTTHTENVAHIPEWGVYSKKTYQQEETHKKNNQNKASFENAFIPTVDREKLYERLKQILSIENAIEVAAEHQKALSLRSGVSKERISQIQNLLTKLINESKRRRLILYNMIKRLDCAPVEGDLL